MGSTDSHHAVYSAIDPGWKCDPPALLSVGQAAWFLFCREDETAIKRVRRLIDRSDILYIADGKRKWVPWSEIQRLKGEEEERDVAVDPR